MSRSPVRRAGAALLALFFLLAVGEPLALHACPMHDGVAVASSTSAGGAHADMPADAHAAHAADTAAAVPAGHPSGDDEGHQCSCLGHCAAASGAALAAAQAVRWPVLVARRAEPPAREYRIALPSADYLLPFANGPPHLA
jgi:hypothetical protein